MQFTTIIMLVIASYVTPATVYRNNGNENILNRHHNRLNNRLNNRHNNRNILEIQENIKHQILHNPGSTLMRLDNVKADACEMKQYNQTVVKNRCHVRQVPNTFCAGLCNSFHVPGEHDLKVSRCCAATKTVKEKVALDCPGRRRRHGNVRMVTVTRVLACGCTQV